MILKEVVAFSNINRAGQFCPAFFLKKLPVLLAQLIYFF